jgi:hypothetical protein
LFSFINQHKGKDIRLASALRIFVAQHYSGEPQHEVVARAKWGRSQFMRTCEPPRSRALGRQYIGCVSSKGWCRCKPRLSRAVTILGGHRTSTGTAEEDTAGSVRPRTISLSRMTVSFLFLADHCAYRETPPIRRVTVLISGAPHPVQLPSLAKSKTKMPASQPAARSSTSGRRSAFTVSR